MTNQPGLLRAVWDALRGEGLDHYPREDDRVLKPDAILDRINGVLKGVQLGSPSDAKAYIDRAKDSLDEVKKITEYQDQKVSRLLTIVAFLTAAAGALFSKVVDVFPLHPALETSSFSRALVATLYGAFGLYLLLVACGALVTFYATQTRFLWENGDSDDAHRDRVGSFLFYRSILTTKPEAWAAAFVDASTPPKPSEELLAAYYRNYIAEAYLVAAKVGDKLRYLQPAQTILLLAIRVLLLWLVTLILTFWFLVPAVKAEAAAPKRNTISLQSSDSATSASSAPYAGSRPSAPLDDPAIAPSQTTSAASVLEGSK